MANERVDLGFADALDGLDLMDFQPKPKAEKRPRDLPERKEAAKAAAALGFSSREAKPTNEPEQNIVGQRRRRTGRNVQFNIKARPETIEAYCAIADSMGWGLGETLEKAVELLSQTYENR